MKNTISASAVALMALSANAMACAVGNDCGTVSGSGFGQNCEWFRVQSTVFGKVTTYGVPLGDYRPILEVAIKGGPIAVRPGAQFPSSGPGTCQGGNAFIVEYMSNDPAEQ